MRSAFFTVQRFMVYLGVDGGGTKTRVVAGDENKNIILKETGETINFYSVGMKKARENFKSIIDRVSKKLGVCEFESVFIGSSALECEADEKTIRDFTHGILKAKKIGMNSDLFVALKSAKCDGAKIVVISGTGSMATGEDEKGNISKRGGWGHILGDEGSAYSISLSLLKKAVKEYDNSRSETLISEICEKSGVDDFSQLTDFIYSENTTKEKIASLSVLVDQKAQKGDLLCSEILKSECEALFETVKPLVCLLGENTPVFLYGGVFQNSAFFRNEFISLVNNDFPDIDVSLLDTPPENGALFESYKL